MIFEERCKMSGTFTLLLVDKFGDVNEKNN